jgi:hypothetical protein
LSNPDANHVGDQTPSEDDIATKLQFEIAKQVVVSRLEVVKTATATLQTLNGVFLTAYLGFLAAARTNPASMTFDLFGSLWPIPLFLISLIVGFVTGVAHPGFWLVVGDLDGAVYAYEQVVKSRRRQLIMPATLTLIGVILAICKLLAFSRNA